MADIPSGAATEAQPIARQIAPTSLFWSGVASGAVLILLLSATALSSRSHGPALLVLLIASNLVFLARCIWRRPPAGLTALFALTRGIHWALSMTLAGLALLLLLHAETPIRALAAAAIALMLVLSAAAARRLTLAPAPR